MKQYSRVNFFTSKTKLKKIVVIFVGLLLLYLYMAGDAGFFKIWKHSHKKKMLLEEISVQKQIKEKNNEIKKKLIEKDADFIEKKAREELGMVKKGEQVYLITNEEKEEKK